MVRAPPGTTVRTPVRNHRPEPPCRTDGIPCFTCTTDRTCSIPDTAFQKGQHWRVGETATELITAGVVEPLIVVGIYNTGHARIEEYTPTKDARLGGGLADDYGRLIVEELKPFIDATYRTHAETRRTPASAARRSAAW